MKAKKLIYGVGVNDADYATRMHEEIGGKRVKVWGCPYYTKWRSMLNRCYCEKLHLSHPTYTGCTVDAQWHSFMSFRSWMEAQEWEGMNLDKDILIQGNKVYGPNTCVFISTQTNNFLCDGAAARGELPIGVSAAKYGKYAARVRYRGEQRHLGTFSTPDEAHQAWRAAKYNLAVQLASEQADPRVALALIERYKI